MREFNVELAKVGAPLKTRKGNKARIVCYDRVDKHYKGTILALILNNEGNWERPVFYHTDGKCATALDPDLDLMIDDGK